jgi:hypothetical protein
MIEENRLFWLAIFSFLIIMTVILLVDHSRAAIILVGAIIFCGLLYHFSKQMEGKNAKRTKRA